MVFYGILKENKFIRCFKVITVIKYHNTRFNFFLASKNVFSWILSMSIMIVFSEKLNFNISFEVDMLFAFFINAKPDRSRTKNSRFQF